MPSSRVRDSAARSRRHRSHRTPSNQRSSSASLPERTARLADEFRPRTTRSHLTRRPDGLYNEPYSAVVHSDEGATLLCVQRTTEQVLVRHMPEREWQRIMRDGDEVHPGVDGQTSLHLVAPSAMSTMPPVDSSRSAQQPGSPGPGGAAEPPVFDYFVAPENRVEQLRRSKKESLFAYFTMQTHYSREELERIAREDRRAMLSVDRRNIFLRQYQRELQHRLASTPLYTVGRELPEEFVQLFFMFEGQHGVRRQRGGGNTGGPHLFTIDRSSTCFGERMPFAGQAPADGFVVVTVGPALDAVSWHPWDEARRLTKAEAEEPFVPHDYGTAEYLPRPPTPTPPQHEETVAASLPAAAPKMPSSAPLSLATAGPGAAHKKASGCHLNSRESSLSKSSPLCSPLHKTHPRRFAARGRTTSADRSGSANDEQHGSRWHTATPMPLPLSSGDDEDADEETEGRVRPMPASSCVIVE